MIQPAAREPEARADVFEFEVRHLLDDLLGREPVRQKVQHVTHPNPHPANAGTPTALLRVHRYAIRQLNHDIPPLRTRPKSSTGHGPSKQLRSTGADDALNLTPIRKLTLEDALEYIGEDELVEITPESIRLHKKVLEPGIRNETCTLQAESI
ncbi:MAG: hypothetical protein WKF67_09405 [Rubrobacteraceae bacterium]